MSESDSLEKIGDEAITRASEAAKALVGIHGHKTVANRLGVHQNTLMGWINKSHEPSCSNTAMLMALYEQEVVVNSSAIQKVGD